MRDALYWASRVCFSDRLRLIAATPLTHKAICYSVR